MRVSARALVWQCPGTLAGAGAAQSVQESRVLASSVRVLDGRTTLPPTSGCQRIWGRPSENSGQHSTPRGQGPGARPLQQLNHSLLTNSPIPDSAAFMSLWGQVILTCKNISTHWILKIVQMRCKMRQWGSHIVDKLRKWFQQVSCIPIFWKRWTIVASRQHFCYHMTWMHCI